MATTDEYEVGPGLVLTNVGYGETYICKRCKATIILYPNVPGSPLWDHSVWHTKLREVLLGDFHPITPSQL